MTLYRFSVINIIEQSKPSLGVCFRPPGIISRMAVRTLFSGDGDGDDRSIFEKWLIINSPLRKGVLKYYVLNFAVYREQYVAVNIVCK